MTRAELELQAEKYKHIARRAVEDKEKLQGKLEAAQASEKAAEVLLSAMLIKCGVDMLEISKEEFNSAAKQECKLKMHKDGFVLSV